MRYLPHTEVEIRQMLERIGVASIDELFKPIPEAHSFKGLMQMEPSLDEPRLMAHLNELAAKNTGARALSFLGAGMYDHHIPPALDQLLMRSEFYTAYTPYQAELSQGTLQAIFEFQTTVCELLGMEVANASMYDGASAAAEAGLMARRATRRTHLVVSGAIHPHYLETIRAYLHGLDGTPDMDVAPVLPNGRTDMDAVAALTRDDTAAVVLGYPNFFGCVEDVATARAITTAKKAMLITATAEVYALALLESPGALGADIAVAEGQSLAVPAQFGGPGVGLFSCRQDLVRQMPGRLVGETLDADGQRGYVLTLSTREQHIRRERATSNICTNHGLIALALTMRTALLGRSGFDQAARLCLSSAEYLKTRLAALPGVSLPFSAPTFNEFVVRLERVTAAAVVAEGMKEEMLAGVDLATFDATRTHDLLVAVTEKHSKADLDRLVTLISRL
ncbi:MAG: aminomethyl-transferring glycine dehydrogenase subunit GcvPA [Sandaracinaceae bacterium]|nr:aminomethyl-transferring glycine dehydrogenase subunit GcvPA [Sandaracinaceae bacterium]MBP7680823.1 aminomethyl-transferring glycine dehydrogenase subunit GcvPA [Deltaproteobacteria bacterium]MBK7153677.1 aminomethyl-transferring glycine dehydrogenase subunit GcvPA [Sandaracinaceae bacterium]MBK7775178.1 aminomethyl-transferring glycine dehydrogenase subunit GcvPA [Sandaracinaceae bacterium]MBK8408356.1 aminomethyl-transferring glycine dehydrogenase subunit GcvPA [Sandaracinaceae bacterium]